MHIIFFTLVILICMLNIAEYCIPCVQLAYRFRKSSDREECDIE